MDGSSMLQYVMDDPYIQFALNYGSNMSNLNLSDNPGMINVDDNDNASLVSVPNLGSKLKKIGVNTIN